eukprot:7999895-Lingulodinium_polyedra.AAC.1
MGATGTGSAGSTTPGRPTSPSEGPRNAAATICALLPSPPRALSPSPPRNAQYWVGGADGDTRAGTTGLS